MLLVINRTYGGFGISKEGAQRLKEMGNPWALKDQLSTWSGPAIPRDDQDLVSLVQLNSEMMNASSASLGVVEIPDGTNWYIGECDGMEWVAEGRTWPHKDLFLYMTGDLSD